MTGGWQAGTPAGPLRGARPANRRDLIVRAAADLFYRKGYAATGMGEVAKAVDIGPSALYRHFGGKQDLLATVVGDALNTVDAALAAASAIDVGARLASVAIEHRGMGVLWRREVRHLSTDNRTELRAITGSIVTRLAALIRARRPELGAAESDLLARSALAVVISVSFHGLSLRGAGLRTELGELVSATIGAPITPSAPTGDQSRSAGIRRRSSRREIILIEAAKLFAHNGFAGVRMDDIGIAAGISGTSIYNHFPAKTDILMAAIFRGDERLRIGLNRAFEQAIDPPDGLRRLLRAYGAFVFENPDLVQLITCESVHLSAPDRERGRAAQHSYLAEWVHLARQVHPTWDPSRARIRVQAVQSIANELALTPRCRPHPGIESTAVAIGEELLAISDT
ncbi:TetR/AcrR family transcriptional regulator [Nocardia sp. NPDC127606]|uniref:TetR/AcrR family transcriptional regulator n=1 Tax=Nocardia sp. NPDC127606 TaxID=3345406 RepID=UPI00363C8084